jgi:3-oxoacyl-[acyl-carrier protein] reductase
MLLTNKIALITGASRGIGRATALRLAQSGARVLCVSRSLDSLQETLTAVRALGLLASGYAVDVADYDAVQVTTAEMLKEFERIDILVNNAGVTRDGLLMRMSVEDWDTVVNTNLRGAFNFTQCLSRAFVRQKAGRIINIASVIGLIGNAGQANYAASKAGLIGFTKSIAREFGSRGITCNAVCPGFIETDMTAGLSEEVKQRVLTQIPANRYGQPEEVAALIHFLCTAEAGYITGQALAIDGGMVMS